MKKTLKYLGFFLFWLSITQPVFSHGTVIYPPSRIYNCYNNPSTPVCNPCGNAIYNWMGVLQPNTNFGNHQALIPDGQIASGGNGSAVDFSCLNALTADWPTTKVNHGYIDVEWRNTAPHKTQYYKVYITQLNWDPTKPLRWNDLIEIGHLGQGPPASSTTIRSFIPDSYAGKRAALVSIWQRDYNDSHEAFYSVSDILVDDGCTTGDTVSVTFTNNTDCTLQYYQNNSLQGSANAGSSYTANTTVGSQWETRDASGNQVGSFTIACHQTIYTSTGECNGGSGLCDNIPDWSPTFAYTTAGVKVKYNDKIYKNKWWTLNNTPGISSAWQYVSDCNPVGNDLCLSPQWVSDFEYTEAENQVKHNNKVYKNKWWTRGDVPGTTAVWEFVTDCIIVITTSNNSKFIAFPTTVDTNINLTIDTPKVSKVKIELYDFYGRLIRTKSLNRISKGKMNITQDLSGLTSGIYIYKIYVDNEIITQKIIKK